MLYGAFGGIGAVKYDGFGVVRYDYCGCFDKSYDGRYIVRLGMRRVLLSPILVRFEELALQHMPGMSFETGCGSAHTILR